MKASKTKPTVEEAIATVVSSHPRAWEYLSKDVGELRRAALILAEELQKLRGES